MSTATPAEVLRSFVVRTVVLALVGLAFALYALVGYLLVAIGVDAVPDALWLAAGGAAGGLGALLVNSKGDASNTATVDVAAPAQLQPADDVGQVDLLYVLLVVLVVVVLLAVLGVL